MAKQTMIWGKHHGFPWCGFHVVAGQTKLVGLGARQLLENGILVGITRGASDKIAGSISGIGLLSQAEVNKAINQSINKNVQAAYAAKFRSSSWGNWRGIKDSTKKRRRWAEGQGAPGSGDKSLWHTGYMQQAISQNLSLKFDKPVLDVRKTYVGLKGGFSPRGKWQEKHPLGMVAGKWRYFHPKRSIQTFGNLIKHQEGKFGWKISLTWQEVGEKVLPRWTRDLSRIFTDALGKEAMMKVAASRAHAEAIIADKMRTKAGAVLPKSKMKQTQKAIPQNKARFDKAAKEATKYVEENLVDRTQSKKDWIEDVLDSTDDFS